MPDVRQVNPCRRNNTSGHLTFPRLGSAVLVQVGARVLLGRRAKDPNRGKWIIPGGKVEPFESIAEAGEREILEETGLTIEVSEQIGIFEIIVPELEHRVIVYSWGNVLSGNVKPADDLSEIMFADKTDLLTLDLTPIVREVLTKVGWLQ